MSATETRTQYVIRRAREVKRYRKVAAASQVGYEWLCKLARGEIKNPGSEAIERLEVYYRELERQAATQAQSPNAGALTAAA
jgi:hypothetical protein